MQINTKMALTLSEDSSPDHLDGKRAFTANNLYQKYSDTFLHRRQKMKLKLLCFEVMGECSNKQSINCQDILLIGRCLIQIELSVAYKNFTRYDSGRRERKQKERKKVNLRKLRFIYKQLRSIKRMQFNLGREPWSSGYGRRLVFQRL